MGRFKEGEGSQRDEFGKRLIEIRLLREKARLREEHERQVGLDQALRVIVSDVDLLAEIAMHGREGQARSTRGTGKKELPFFEQDVYVTHRDTKAIPTLSINQDGLVQVHKWRGGEVAIQAQLLPIDEATSTAILDDGSRLPIAEGDIERYPHLIAQGKAFVVTNGDFLVGKGMMLGEIYNVLSLLHGITPKGLQASTAKTTYRRAG